MTMRHLEDGLQRAVADYLDLRGWLWCHCPNGGKRGKKEAARLKGQGVKAGVPDVLIFEGWAIYSNGRKHEYGHGVAIELKIKSNKPTPAQREWLANLRARGWSTHVCWTIDEVIEVCKVIK